MLLSDFDYDLPQELIAQEPIYPRDASRMLVLRRTTGEVEHRTFQDLPDYLVPGDVLVLNDTKVYPARVYAQRRTGAKVELLLLRKLDERRWEALVSPGKRARSGERLLVGNGSAEVLVGERTDAGGRVVEFDGGMTAEDVLRQFGRMPLPPYIKRDLEDQQRYQTVYAREEGSVAAPTAGLHFTPELLYRIEAMGVKVVRITLHVGLDTFRPIHEECVEDHRMHSEEYSIAPEAAEAINSASGRVVAVGTTSVRALESAALQSGVVQPGRRSTRLFIMPGYQFRVVDALLTNFHLPKSTLIVLVSAFAGREKVLSAYREAIERRYRFYSFGDAMLIV
ncbi:MAG: tRNA preQ1(34) S-adenosylmethionine ribosyltransferase-isomerase QueA [Armatimonadota bacterium]